MIQLLTFVQPYLRNYVKSYLLKTENFNIFIDSGLYNGGKNEMAPHITDGRKNVLLMTHGHWDHIGLNAMIREHGGMVFAHEGDRRYMTDYDWHWKMLFGQFQEDFDLPSERHDTFWKQIGKPTVPDAAIVDGDELEFDELRFCVIGLPGHSKGSVGFYEKRQDVLFTGDALMGSGFFDGAPQYCDYDAYCSSMDKLMCLSPRQTLIDHTESIEGKALAAMADEGKRCAERICASVENYVRKTSGAVSVGGAAAWFCSAESKKVGGGACVTALNLLYRMRETDARIPECIQGYECDI